MTMKTSNVKNRVADMWRWPSSKFLLVGASAITVIISLFEIRPDPIDMLREVISNFITCASITAVTATTMAAFGVFRIDRDWKRLPLLVLLLAVGGMAGGLISWGINDLLFPYHISHPLIYMMMVAVLSIIFGLAMTAYFSISAKLAETVSKLAEKEVQEQRLLRLKTEAELEALRARVNPHFLFNTLNSIASLIPEDPRKAEEMVQRMSNLFHYVLTAGDRGLVPLETELDVITEYLEIERVRLGTRLEFDIDRGGALDGVMIPGMLLQPLVENSVKYGIASEKNGGRVEVSCRRDGDRCSITIVDTGRGFDSQSTGEGFGIGGVRQRLELIYPGTHEFDISSDDGVTVRIGIPVTDGS